MGELLICGGELLDFHYPEERSQPQYGREFPASWRPCETAERRKLHLGPTAPWRAFGIQHIAQSVPPAARRLLES